MKIPWEYIVLNLMGILILVKWIKNQFSDYKKYTKKSKFFSLGRFKYMLLVALFVLIPILSVNYTDIETYSLIPSLGNELTNKVVYAAIVSFFISFLWLFYIYKLDVFNKEKKHHILIVFVIASILTLFAEFPYMLMKNLGFMLTKEPVNNLIYSVFGIGLLEESIKFIPLLIILYFSKAIDEPFDYILYASTSALGFAFVENTGYLYSYGLEVINARALYATVAHMTFSSLIGYGLFLIRYKRTKYNPILVFSLFFFLAILTHGLYDFWLLDPTFNSFKWLTTVLFLISVHVWFSIKNNTLNASDFYSEEVALNNDKLKIYLIIGLLSVMMFSYLYIAFTLDSNQANRYFNKMVLVFGFIAFYIIATLTQYNLVKGLVKPFKLTLKFLFPKLNKND